ncbi:helix-turn-helix domain-containing protein [Candidatus Bathyarchaeota archaeon]|nr:helix-turn-helix domain-containing protein [Candidatus Bathyarchaeota archaeon]
MSTESESVSAVRTVLKKGGFSVSQRCCSRPSCFDFAARRDETLVIVKVQSDISNVSSYDSFELMSMSKHLSAATLLVSEKAREKLLEDDTVYSRYNTRAVTLKTFENIVLREFYPLIQAGPGGYYVEIDGEIIKRRRQELGLSVGELAEMMGTSRRTLYGYERRMAKASVSTAYNLLRILEVPVAKPINVFDKRTDETRHFLSTAKRAIAKSRLLQKILKKLAQCNITPFRKAPFDFMVDVKENGMRIIGGVINNNEQELPGRVNEILSISRIVQAYPILITEGQKIPDEDIPCIEGKDISRIKDPKDLIVGPR